MRPALLGLLFLASTAALGCGGNDAYPWVQTGGPGVDLTGEPQPDVLLLSVSGHFDQSVRIVSDANETYINAADEAGPVLRSVFTDRGLTVLERHFADRLSGKDANHDGLPDRLEQIGWLELLAVIEQAWSMWMRGQVNPTRILLVAHSHGTNWAHLAVEACTNRLDGMAIPIHYLVTLDGVVTAWEHEHADTVRDWFQSLPGGVHGGYAFPRSPEHVYAVIPTAFGMAHVKDAVWPNVRYNIEVMSDDPRPVFFDCCPNSPLSTGFLTMRDDPSGTTMFTRDTRNHTTTENLMPVLPMGALDVPSEAHSEVDDGFDAVGVIRSPSMQWVHDLIDALEP